jgi:predicted site-specific integrase-resolvase
MKRQKTNVLLNTPLTAKRVVVYSRVSTQDQDARNQIGQLKDYAVNGGRKV